MDLARRMYSRDLKIAAMREIEGGRRIGEVARQPDLPALKFCRMRATGTAEERPPPLEEETNLPGKGQVRQRNGAASLLRFRAVSSRKRRSPTTQTCRIRPANSAQSPAPRRRSQRIAASRKRDCWEL